MFFQSPVLHDGRPEGRRVGLVRHLVEYAGVVRLLDRGLGSEFEAREPRRTWWQVLVVIVDVIQGWSAGLVTKEPVAQGLRGFKRAAEALDDL